MRVGESILRNCVWWAFANIWKLKKTFSPIIGQVMVNVIKSNIRVYDLKGFVTSKTHAMCEGSTSNKAKNIVFILLLLYLYIFLPPLAE